MIPPSQPSRRDAAVGESKRTRQGMLDEMQRLEAALARATPTRESQWRTDVLSALSTLEVSMQAQAEELAGDQGLLADLLLENARLSTRIQSLRETYHELVQQVESLRSEFAAEQTAQLAPNIADIRTRLAKLVSELREFQSAETDLIFEAAQVDIGVGD